MYAAAAPRRHPLRLAGLIAAGAVLVAALAVLVLYLWLRGYAPLSAATGSFAPGPGLGADVEPVAGSGGKPVFVPVYRQGRTFDTAFTLHNTGRFAVTVIALGSVSGGGQLTPQTLFGTDSSTASADPARLRPFGHLRLERGDTAIVVVRWRLGCKQGGSGQTSSDAVPLRYRYLSLFTRTERVELPFAVTLRCEGGPPAQP
jgi:hypothetical protein